MKTNANAVCKLRDEFSRFAPEGSVQECLDELSEVIARIISAKGCTILILAEDEAGQAAPADGGGLRPLHERLAGSYPEIPAEAVVEPYLAVVRDVDGDTESLISAIVSRGKVVGVIHACRSLQSGGFDESAQDLFSMLTPLVTKSIEVIQLQSILKSRFTQIAIARSDELTIKDLMTGVMQNPNQIARILARSFYREMLNAGFNLNQILFAATEVISELSSSLKKRSAKQKKRATQDIFQVKLMPGPQASAQAAVQNE
jgi:hypothetical protein